jgi:hypothetical protein
MKLFGQIVRTVVNVATLPVALAQDAVRLAADPCRIIDHGDSATVDKLRQIKDEASE